MRSHAQINNNITNLFHLLSYKKDDPIVMGSNAVNDLNYGADYDLFTVVKTHDSPQKLGKELHKELEHLVEIIEKNPNLYFIELMAGVDDNKRPLFWSMKDIKRGVVKSKGKDYVFDNIFQDKSVIKIEVVANVPSVGFVPVSNVYEFRTTDGKGINREAETRDNIDSLKADMTKYHRKGNVMKILKRLYIIAQQEKNKSLFETLQKIFNSDIGKLYKVMSDLGAIKSVIEQYPEKANLGLAYNEIQKLKEQVGVQQVHKFTDRFYKQFDKGSKAKSAKSMIALLDKIMAYLLKVINKLLRKQLKQDKIKYEKFF
jgi:hypothetical protein